MCYWPVCGFAAACQDGSAAKKHEVYSSSHAHKSGDYYRKTGTRIGRKEEVVEYEEYI
jgi:hypothetical protein